MTSGANRGTCDPTLTGLLGGVSVVGTVDCSDLAQQVREQGFAYVDEDDQWQPLGQVGEALEPFATAVDQEPRCDETAGGRGRSVSVLVEVSSEDENGPTYEAYYAPNRWGAYTSTTLTAVGYR